REPADRAALADAQPAPLFLEDGVSAVRQFRDVDGETVFTHVADPDARGRKDDLAAGPRVVVRAATRRRNDHDPGERKKVAKHHSSPMADRRKATRITFPSP